MKCIYPLKLTSIWHLWIHTIETNSYELYHLKNDISETKNLNDSEPVVYAKLKNELENWK